MLVVPLSTWSLGLSEYSRGSEAGSSSGLRCVRAAMIWSLRLDSSLRSARMCSVDHARAPEDIEWGAREVAIQADLQRDYDAMVERAWRGLRSASALGRDADGNISGAGGAPIISWTAPVASKLEPRELASCTNIGVILSGTAEPWRSRIPLRPAAMAVRP